MNAIGRRESLFLVFAPTKFHRKIEFPKLHFVYSLSGSHHQETTNSTLHIGQNRESSAGASYVRGTLVRPDVAMKDAGNADTTELPISTSMHDTKHLSELDAFIASSIGPRCSSKQAPTHLLNCLLCCLRQNASTWIFP